MVIRIRAGRERGRIRGKGQELSMSIAHTFTISSDTFAIGSDFPIAVSMYSCALSVESSSLKSAEFEEKNISISFVEEVVSN